MATGKVKFFNETKGWGFVSVDGEKRDIFAHYSDIEGSGFKTLVEGEAVEFEIVATDKGQKAQKIVRVASNV